MVKQYTQICGRSVFRISTAIPIVTRRICKQRSKTLSRCAQHCEICLTNKMQGKRKFCSGL